MKKLKTAVAGLGRIGWHYHLPAVRNHPGFELVAVADPLEERLAEAGESCGVAGYRTVDELLAQETVDLLVIASPTPYHAEQAVACFAQGVDVLMEKPLARSLAEADDIIDSMKRYRRKMMVYQPHRLTPEFQAVKRLIAGGALGDIYMIKRACSAFHRRNDWQAFQRHGGGMLNNYGAHFIDQLLHLTGSTVGKVTCCLRKIASRGDADDVVKAVFETENGILLDLDINMASAFAVPPWYVMGSLGTAVYREQADGAGVFHLKYLAGAIVPDLSVQSAMAATGRSYDNFDALNWQEEQLDVSQFERIDFYDRCHDYFALDKPPLVPVDETREVMRVLDECRKQAGWQRAASE